MAREHRLLRWVQRLLIAGGFAALAWSAFVLLQAGMYQRLASSILVTRPDVVAPLAAPSPTDASPEPAIVVAVGTPMARLQIPRLGIAAVVLEGSDERTLRRGPGHIENTAWPGQAGNVGIAGHRDTFFRPLRDAQVGDDIFLDTLQGRSVYRVSSVRIVSPREVDVLDATSEPTLTLITCYPFWFVGDAPMRFVVHATRVDVD